LPQWPQLSLLVVVSTQAVPQAVVVPGQVQLELLQVAPVGQGVLQLPQCSVSLLVSTHLPPQVASPPPHTQPPPWQTAPVPILLTQLSSTAGSSSMIPSQSLSFPSQISAT
jgi:hypothetical protein